MPSTKRKPKPKKSSVKRKSTPTRTSLPIHSPSKPDRNTRFPVVGLGASAGGLAALKALFTQLPSDTGMAFTIIQHLSPGHFSMLSELIQSTTRMPVKQVQQETFVEPNHVYVISPNTNLSIENGKLFLNRIEAARGHNLPVDFFFKSLAEDYGEMAVGVVLSGMASDGAQGLKTIKESGGITIVQDPANVEYKGMPQAAIEAGGVEFVMDLDEIVKKLVEISRQDRTRERFNSSPSFADSSRENERGLKRLFAMIRQRTRMDFSLYKYPTVYRRISRRMDLHRIRDFRAYLDHLEQNPAEIDELYQDLLINVTGFFRDGEVFDALKVKVFPEILRNKGENEPIKIWVPGCSTGEEVYSLVMALHEYLGESSGAQPILVYGTDVSANMIAKARRGIYPEQAVRDMPADRLRRFFIKEEGEYRLTRQIRERCIFSTQNVTCDPPIGKLDLLSCRNLMIYLRAELQERVLTTFHYALVPGGFMLLGASEGIGSMARLFSLYDKQHKIYIKKEIATRPRLEIPPGHIIPEQASTEEHVLKLPPPTGRFRRETEIPAEADKVVLAHYAPPGVLINRDMEILQFRGSTGRYLEASQGPASLNLMKMVREGIMPELRIAIQKAIRRNVTVRKEGLRVRSNGHLRSLDIEVVPVIPSSGDSHFLVLFLERQEVEPSYPKKRSGKRVRITVQEREIEHMREKLSASQSSLQSLMEDQEAMREELQSSNEEVLSSNEELQSTNEELETAKEELQSSNEELTTMNDELTHRNEELSKVNDDLNNLLTSFHIPIIIVNQDLKIRRFTPMAGKLMNLIATDVDRPITDIAPNIQLHGLAEILRDVVDNVTTREIDLQDNSGHWYSLRVRPYRTADRKIDGAVIVLIDIDEFKKVERSVLAARDYADTLIGAIQSPLLVLKDDLKALRSNQAFSEFIGIDPTQIEGKSIYELGGQKFDFKVLRPLLENVLPKNRKVTDFKAANNISVDATLIESGTEKFVILLFDGAQGK